MSAEEFDDVKRAWRELGDEPVPRALDARVRAMARAAVATESEAAAESANAAQQSASGANVVSLDAQRARRRWVVPASLAATVVIAFGLAQRVFEQSPPGAVETRVPAMDAAPAATDAASPPAGATATDAAASAVVPADEPPAQQPAARSIAADAADASARREAAPLAQGAAPMKAAPPAPWPASPAPVRVPAPVSAEPAVSMAAPAAAPIDAPAPRPEAPSSQEREATADRDSVVVSGYSISRESAPAAQNAQPLPAEQRIAPGAAMRTMTDALRKRSTDAAKSEDSSAAPERSPEAWLADIEALRRAGRTADADAELARFRAAYPDWHDR